MQRHWLSLFLVPFLPGQAWSMPTGNLHCGRLFTGGDASAHRPCLSKMGHQPELRRAALAPACPSRKRLLSARWRQRSVQKRSVHHDISCGLSWKSLDGGGLDTPRIAHGIASVGESTYISKTNRTGRNPNLPWSVKEAEVPISSEANLKLKEENECIEEIRSSFPSTYLMQVIAN